MALLFDPLKASDLPAKGGAPARTGKRRPQARLRALDGGGVAVADWASLHGDLARRPLLAPEAEAPVEWRVHDRTHVEFAIDYPLRAAPSEHAWEAYFFVPESFRLHEDTYDKKEIYDDLSSYVRYAVPAVPFHELADLTPGGPLARVRDALAGAACRPEGSKEAAVAMRRLRLFACLVRASGLSAMRDVDARAARGTGAPTSSLARSFVATCGAVAGAFRRVLDEAEALPLPDRVAVAARWIDEDLSLVLETFCATLGVSLEAVAPDVAEQLASYAVREARHRRARGYDSVGSGAADEARTEHFEFRRHLLKRFSASALWLSLEVRKAATWAIHAVYALAAATAMASALAVTLRADASRSFVRYALPLVVAYAMRDRLKALLQGVLAGWIAKRFPDRKWSIRDRERGRRVGKVHEWAAFLPFHHVPPDVLATRRLTRTHELEEQARPERVLWHRKTVLVHGAHAPDGGSDFSMITEIFRLNLHRWLQHTDDPNRKVVFADPEDALVYQVTTRRVYNISVVYRLRSAATDGAWHRIRVVVSRKGIERIDAVC